MFLAVLFILVKILKQSICASVSKWIGKLRYIQTMGYYSVLKKKKLTSHEKTCRKQVHIAK